MMLIEKGKFSVVLPGCCKKSIQARMPFLQLINNDKSDNPVPEWRCPNPHYEMIMALSDENTGSMLKYYNSDLSMNYCPFCGKKLPKVMRVNRPGLKIHKSGDGGYYCASCNERNRECECLPEIVLFEVSKID